MKKFICLFIVIFFASFSWAQSNPGQAEPHQNLKRRTPLQGPTQNPSAPQGSTQEVQNTPQRPAPSQNPALPQRPITKTGKGMVVGKPSVGEGGKEAGDIDNLVKSVGLLKGEVQDPKKGEMPLWKQIITIISHKDFVHYLEAIHSKSNIQLFWFFEGLALIFCIGLRGWKFARPLSFERYLWVEIWTFYLAVTIMFLVIPLVLFQKDFISLIIVGGILFGKL